MGNVNICLKPQNVVPKEIALLHGFNKHLKKFKLFIWKVGRKLTYPDDKNGGKYQYPKGDEEFFTEEPNISFPSFLLIFQAAGSLLFQKEEKDEFGKRWSLSFPGENR